MPENPVISVVVPSYNQGIYIEDTITSVLSQDYKHLELIVMDAGSTDNTIEILRKYEKDTRLRWVSEPDHGPADAYNKGMLLARGDIIGLQNSSDTYQPNVFSEAVREFRADPKLALVAGSVLEIDVNGQPTGDAWESPAQKFYYSLDGVIDVKKNYPPGQSGFFRRDINLAIGGMKSNAQFALTLFQLHYMLEALRLGFRLLRVPMHWGNYRRHPNMYHEKLLDCDVGLSVVLDQVLATKHMAERYKDYLTPKQIRDLRRPAYLKEFRYRVGTLRQLIPAIPALLGYFRFGGRLGGQGLRPQVKNPLAYMVSLFVGRIVNPLRNHRTSSKLFKPKT